MTANTPPAKPLPPTQPPYLKYLPTVHSARLVARANQLFARRATAGVDQSGNRKLLDAHYTSLVLLSFFNPHLQCLRGLQEASRLRQVPKRLGVRRTSLARRIHMYGAMIA